MREQQTNEKNTVAFEMMLTRDWPLLRDWL